MVLEANTFAKTKQTLESLESEAAESSGKSAKAAIECTPMKPLKQPPIMDMTLSPIVNKSILHSSNDSITASAEKEPKSDSNTDLNTIPAFTLHETYFEKSVLHSYQSSVGESSKSTSITEEVVTRTVTEKTLPAFTTIHDDFGKSVLHSYESSAAGTTQSFEMSPKAEASKSKAYIPATPKTDFGSVLHSHQSSIANDTTQTINASSLLTDDNDEIGDKDNDVEMTEEEKVEQKEKKQLGEIERLRDEIQDMDNDMMPSGEDESGSEDGSEEGSESDVSFKYAIDLLLFFF